MIFPKKKIPSKTKERITVKDIERDLDKITSEIILLRDKKCIQCGSTFNLGRGHVFPRRVRAVRWDFCNNFIQCNFCNHNHNLDRKPYDLVVKSLIGESQFQIIEDRWNQAPKIDYIELLDTLNDFNNLLQELKINPRKACELTYPHHEFINNRCVYCSLQEIN